MRKGEREGKGREGGGCYSLDAKASGLEGRWGWRTCCPATHLLASALLSLYDQFLISFSLSLSFSPWAAGRMFVPVPPLFGPSDCWRRDASELATEEKRWWGVEAENRIKINSKKKKKIKNGVQQEGKDPNIHT